MQLDSWDWEIGEASGFAAMHPTPYPILLQAEKQTSQINLWQLLQVFRFSEYLLVTEERGFEG